ncbi:MAG: pilus assembly protein PilP [Variovorax sp.]|nr:pilus assembly protein PilP [Variovorax sp.]
MTRLCLSCSAAVLIALGGCSGSDQEQLQGWMTEQRSQAHPTVKPITAPKKFMPQAYTEGSAYEPFNSQKLTQALRRDSTRIVSSALITPELARRKEALESFPLDSLTMVGSLDRGRKLVALVQAEKLLYQVRVGDHLGLNYGRITRITETELALREIVQDAGGEWIERVATLQLQEKQEKQ